MKLLLIFLNVHDFIYPLLVDPPSNILREASAKDKVSEQEMIMCRVFFIDPSVRVNCEGQLILL